MLHPSIPPLCGGMKQRWNPDPIAGLRPAAEKKPPPLPRRHSFSLLELHTVHFVTMATQTLIIHTLPPPARQILLDL